MNLQVTQIISLIYNYNVYIESGVIPSKYLDSLVFENCETVGYILVRNYITRAGLDGEIVASNPVKWFRLLEKEGCVKLSLHYRLPQDSAPKEGQSTPVIKGTFCIEAIYKTYSNFWLPGWFWKKNSAGRGYWDVRYYLAYRFEDTLNEKMDLQGARDRLLDVLQRCISFAMDNDFLKFADVFSVAFNILTSPYPQSIFNFALIRNEAESLETRQVLYAALTAFISPDEPVWQTKLKSGKNSGSELATELYQTIIDSLLATANQPVMGNFNR